MYYENMPLFASLYCTIILSFSCIHRAISCLEHSTAADRVTRGCATAARAKNGEFPAVGRRLVRLGQRMQVWPTGSRLGEIGLIEDKIWIYGRQCKAVRWAICIFRARGRRWTPGHKRAQSSRTRPPRRRMPLSLATRISSGASLR